jgi:hypothetical protein
VSGWRFFLIDLESKRCLGDVRREYIDSLADDVEDEEGADGEEDDT